MPIIFFTILTSNKTFKKAVVGKISVIFCVMSKDQSVQVAVRVRPLVPSEKNRGCESIVRKTLNQPQVVVGSGPKNNDIFTFNHVFAPEDTQEMLYENAVKSMVMNLFKGETRRTETKEN